MSAEEVLARLSTLEREAATLRQEVAIARQGAVTPELLQRLAELPEAVARAAAAQRPTRELVDSKGLGRPGNFGSGPEAELFAQFRPWITKVENYVVSVFQDCREMLRAAAALEVHGDV